MFHEVLAIIPSLKSTPGIATPEQKKQKKMLIILGIVVLITIVFIYYNSSSSPSASQNIPAGNTISEEGTVVATGVLPIATQNIGALKGQQEEIPSLENVHLDFSVFDNPRFTALREFTPALDISDIEKGRRNPFLSY